LNGKIERPNRTIAERVRCFLINAGRTKQDWFYAYEHAADIYCAALHSAVDMSHDEAWYGTRALDKDMHIWGCRILVPARDLKKSQDRASQGYLYAYIKSQALLP
jgi:hypothetical protein